MEYTANTIKRFLSVLVLLSVLTVPVALSATDGPGCTGANYLTYTVGSKSVAMGEAVAALSGDQFTWLSSPGTFHFMEGSGVGITHAEWLIDTRFNNLSYYQRISDMYVFSGAITYTYRPDIQGYDSYGIETSKLQSYNYVAQAGVGFTPVDQFTVGMNLKYFREKLDSWAEGGICFDLGALFTIESKNIALGFVLQNIGPDLESETMKEPLPMTIRFGASHNREIIKDKFGYGAVFDLVNPRFEDPYLSAGIELQMYNILSVRGGYLSQESKAGNNLTMGCGIRVQENLSIDYAWASFGDLDSIHKVSIFWKLD
ncbi:MAG: PorV/PorQ family protein [Candidatus Krumholzibacteriota bacterium]|nr:PorV/PorQ family protein [Candidatus Krumholzibacteriota bacterium]